MAHTPGVLIGAAGQVNAVVRPNSHVMDLTSYIELRAGERWRDVADAFMTYCARELCLDQCGCHEGDADGAPSDGKRYAAILIPEHSAFLHAHLREWASKEHCVIAS